MACCRAIITDTVDSLGKDIEETKKRIEANSDEIAKAKARDPRRRSPRAGIQLAPEQVDLLLDSVLSGDLVRLVAVFNSAKLIDGQLGKLMTASGENIGAARKYFAMHAALFAMLVHAQDMHDRQDRQAVSAQARSPSRRTSRRPAPRPPSCCEAENRPDQRARSKPTARASGWPRKRPRATGATCCSSASRWPRRASRATHDLRIADNTFETVEASFQLRNLMRDSATSFEAMQKLEAPTFEQIFKNEELRREFENLTRKLDAPSS